MAMMHAARCAILATALAAGPAWGQHEHASPYAGFQDREIKARSAEDLAALREGQGMGFALAAELNSYPGPRHVLEMERGLALTPRQITSIRAISERMGASARTLGDSIVRYERELDHAFRERVIDDAQLRWLTGVTARLEGALRAVHLGAHLEVANVLSGDQIRRYDEMRGYR